MISDTRAEAALRYLAETDEACANAKAEMERAEFKVKVTKQTIFRHSEGTVAERTALADTSEFVLTAHEDYCAAMETYSHFANKRETERIVLDTWRTICANRRQG